MNYYIFLRNIRVFVLDMDGTVYIDDRLLPGAKEFISYLQEKGIDFVFFTNNSSKSRQMYREKLQRLGISVEEDRILSSTEVMIEFLHRNYRNQSVFALGTRSFLSSLEREGILLINDRADTETMPDIVLVAFDTDLDYRKLNLACHYIRRGARFLATHPDINCPCEYGYMIDCGAICDAITSSTGVKPIYTGKPARLTLEMIAKIKNCSENEICFVGDRLYTDIACGVNNGAFGALVLSGETTAEMLQHSEVQPSVIFEHLGAFYEAYKKEIE